MSASPAVDKSRLALSPSEQRVLPVLSMHCCGGSLVVRLMNILGVELGWPLRPAGPDDVRGSWENQMFSEINSQILVGVGGHRDAMAAPEVLTECAAKVARLALPEADQREVGRRFSHQFMHSAWGWKDPRTAVNWPFWGRLLGDLGYRDVRPVIVVRHPDDCFEAMKRLGVLREGAAASGMSEVDFAHSMWWATYQILMACDLDAEKTLVIFLEDLLDPETAPVEVARLGAHVRANDSCLEEALAWIDEEPRARRSPPSDPALFRMHEGLKALALGQRQEFLKHSPRLPTRDVKPTSRRRPEEEAPYCIFQVSPAGYPHAHAFDEIAIGLHHGFEALGYRAPIVRKLEEVEGTPIVVGGNLLGQFSDTLAVAEQLPADTVIYNLEQIDADSEWLTDKYLDLLRRFRVWDYSPANAERLRGMDVAVEGVCGIGFVPAFSRINQNVEEDIDVLFYGGLNPRRQAVLDELKKRGLNVVVAVNCFGEARDRLVARSKVVLNIHYYEAKVLEMVRISYLLANGQCVVSEVGEDRHEEAVFAEAIAFSSYEGLVARCVELVGNESARRSIGLRAKELFSSMHQAHFLSERLS